MASPHITWATVLWPLALAGRWARATFPGAPPWVLAAGAVAAGWAAGRVGSRALAVIAQVALAAAGVGVAYFVLRVG